LLAGPAVRIWVILPLMLFGPGYLLERAYPALPDPPAFVRPALWLGLSLSLIGLLYEWATLAGVRLTTPLLIVLASIVGLAVTWSLWRDARATTARELIAPTTVVFLAIFGLAFWTRLVEIQDLALPPWVDSVHHALMIRVAAEQGQAPYSLRPYLPVDNLPYHWGYHVFSAAVMQLSGVALPQVMLWGGQMLNALHVLACAALASYVWRKPLAGIVAGLVVGLISIMPAYYLSWGRYTQLTGLLMLPALVILWHAGLRAPSRRVVLYTALLLAGLCIVHFRILIFALGLAGAVAIVWALAVDYGPLRAGLKFILQSAFLGIALSGPWLWLIAGRALVPAFDQPVLQLGEDGYNTLNQDLLWAGQNRMLIALALAAALWGLRRRARPAIEQVAWVGALVVLANPWLASYLLPAAGASVVCYGLSYRRPLVACFGAPLLLLNPALLHLPYLRLIPNDIVAISLFIPIGVLLGGAAAALSARLNHPTPIPTSTDEHLRFSGLGSRVSGLGSRFAGALLLAFVALWGAWNLRSVVNPATVFATPADAKAIAWAAEHTPADARFLINATKWLPGVERGADGGWWLLPLTGRWTSTPPAIFTYAAPDDVRAIQQRSQIVADFRPGQERAIYDLIDREQITHVYLGAQPGLLKSALFANPPGFETIYNEDGVIILAVHPHS
jgi:hypothetical protein